MGRGSGGQPGPAGGPGQAGAVPRPLPGGPGGSRACPSATVTPRGTAGCDTGLGDRGAGYRLDSVTSEVLSNLSDSVIFQQLNCSRQGGCSSLGSFLFKYKSSTKYGRQGCKSR